MARLYDAALGGKDNYEPDRDLVSELAQIAPRVKDIVAENRNYLARTVSWLTGQGVAQFLDLGCGTPVAPNVHETARAINPDARVAYVDIDPVAINHMTTFARPGSGVTAVLSDAGDPEATLAALDGALDFAEPVAVLMCALLHFFEPAAARELVAAYRSVLAPGSYLALSVFGKEGTITERFVSVFSEAVTPVYPVSAGEVTGLLASFEIIPPGVVAQELWRPGWEQVPTPKPRDIWVHGAVARVPDRR